MKKVCFCLKMPHGSYIGGIAAMINSYVAGNNIFRQFGFEVSVYDQDASKADKIHFSPLQTFYYGFQQYRGLCNKIEKREIDILHIHTSCRTLFLKDVLLLRQIYIKYGTKIYLTIHVGNIDTVFEKIPIFLHKKLIRILNNCAHKVLFLSEEMRRQFISLGIGEKKTEILYNFSDLQIDIKESEEDESTMNCRDTKRLNLLFVGMINRDKGIIELLKALNVMDSDAVHLDIGGTITDSSIKDEFERLVDEAKEKVTLHGYVSGEKKINLYKNADILILPSYHEGMPLVVLEALSAACAIISTPVGSTPEILSKENAEWIEVGSVESIKRAIEKLACNDKRLRKMKKDNYQLSRKYTKQAHISKLCNLYLK